jgi:lipopolysaccharide export LptBFGC system permease protein LptF
MRNFFLLISIFIFITLTACAPKVAYQAQDSLHAAAGEASSQARQTKKTSSALNKDRYKMKGDIHSIKEAERLFDKKSGIVLSY